VEVLPQFRLEAGVARRLESYRSSVPKELSKRSARAGYQEKSSGKAGNARL